jgi:hypothetical protein
VSRKLFVTFGFIFALHLIKGIANENTRRVRTSNYTQSNRSPENSGCQFALAYVASQYYKASVKSGEALIELCKTGHPYEMPRHILPEWQVLLEWQART